MLGTLPSRQFPSVQVTPAATILTLGYVAGAIISTDEANALCVDLTYTHGDETSIQVKVESTNDSGTLTNTSNWYQQVTQTASGGTATITPAIYSMTAAGLPTTQKFTFIINPIKGTGFRVSVQATGGTPTGTYSVQAYTAWV